LDVLEGTETHLLRFEYNIDLCLKGLNVETEHKSFVVICETLYRVHEARFVHGTWEKEKRIRISDVYI